MGISLENVVAREPKKGRFVDMSGYISRHGLRVTTYRGVEVADNRQIAVWDCVCPRCAKTFPIRQNSIDVYKSCGCGCRVSWVSTEAKDLRKYHKQLMTQPERLCERWQDADTFIADIEPTWIAGYILCRPDESRPFAPDNMAKCPSHGHTRKSKVYNLGTAEKPNFISSVRVLKMLKISRTRLHAIGDQAVIRRVKEYLSHQSAGEGQPHPDPRPTESSSP